MTQTACDSAGYLLQRHKFARAFKVFSARLQKKLPRTCCSSTENANVTKGGDSGASSKLSAIQACKLCVAQHGCICAEMLVSTCVTSFLSNEV